VKALYLAKSGGFAPVMIEFEKDGAAPIRVLPKTYS
jgi:hypothetical protein